MGTLFDSRGYKGAYALKYRSFGMGFSSRFKIRGCLYVGGMVEI